MEDNVILEVGEQKAKIEDLEEKAEKETSDLRSLQVSIDDLNYRINILGDRINELANNLEKLVKENEEEFEEFLEVKEEVKTEEAPPEEKTIIEKVTPAEEKPTRKFIWGVI